MNKNFSYKKYLSEIDTLEYVDIPNDAYNIWNSKSPIKDIVIPNSIFMEYNKLLVNPVKITVIGIEKYQKDDIFYKYNKKMIRVEFHFKDYMNKIILFDYDEIMNKIRANKIKRLIND